MYKPEEICLVIGKALLSTRKTPDQIEGRVKFNKNKHMYRGTVPIYLRELHLLVSQLETSVLLSQGRCKPQFCEFDDCCACKINTRNYELAKDIFETFLSNHLVNGSNPHAIEVTTEWHVIEKNVRIGVFDSSSEKIDVIAFDFTN